MTKTFQIVREIVNQMNFDIAIKSIDNYTLSVCKTLTLKVGETVTDGDGNAFIVTSIVMNSQINLLPVNHTNSFVGFTLFTQLGATYIQGKWISVNNEYLQMDLQTQNKTPLIWLVRGYEEKRPDWKTGIKLESEPLIYFLTESDNTAWLNNEVDENAIIPMQNLADLFVETARQSGMFTQIKGERYVDEIRFGVKRGDKGNERRILSDDLSGIGLRIPFKFLGNCKTCNF
jgi:hypothetical protein